MTKSLVSIIMPVFNAAPWLRAAIESVITQTWPTRELIIIDDGSSDASVAIAEEYVRRGVILLQQSNQGASVARNVGLAAAGGDFVQYLDADDVLDRNKIELQVAALRRAPERVATCAWARFVASTDDASFQPTLLWKDFGPVDYLVAAYAHDRFMPNHAWLIPRSIADRAGSWPPMRARNDDAEYFARVVLASAGTRFVPSARVYYRSGHAGLSAARDRPAVEGYYWTLEQISQHLLRREDSSRTRRALATSYDHFARSVGQDLPELGNAAEQRVRELAGVRFAPLGSRLVDRVLTSLFGRPATQRARRAYRALRSSRRLRARAE